jgi:hypothetical protein
MDEDQVEKQGPQHKDECVFPPYYPSSILAHRSTRNTTVHLHVPLADSNPLNRDSWLARQQGKKKNRTIVCWCFWLFFLVFVAAIVGVIIWLVGSGVFDNLGHHDDDGDDGKGASSSSQQ